MNVSPITLACWFAAVLLAVLAPSHNGVWFAALILWGFGCAPIIYRWTRTGGVTETPPVP